MFFYLALLAKFRFKVPQRCIERHFTLTFHSGLTHVSKKHGRGKGKNTKSEATLVWSEPTRKTIVAQELCVRSSDVTVYNYYIQLHYKYARTVPGLPMVKHDQTYLPISQTYLSARPTRPIL